MNMYWVKHRKGLGRSWQWCNFEVISKSTKEIITSYLFQISYFCFCTYDSAPQLVQIKLTGSKFVTENTYDSTLSWYLLHSSYEWKEYTYKLWWSFVFCSSQISECFSICTLEGKVPSSVFQLSILRWIRFLADEVTSGWGMALFLQHYSTERLILCLLVLAVKDKL